jgi:hypothetical protein
MAHFYLIFVMLFAASVAAKADATATPLASPSMGPAIKLDFISAAAVSNCDGTPTLFVYRASLRELDKFELRGVSPVFVGSVTMTDLAVGAQAQIAAFQAGQLACVVAVGAVATKGRFSNLQFVNGVDMTLGSTIPVPLDVVTLAADDINHCVVVSVLSDRHRGEDFLAAYPTTGVVVRISAASASPVGLKLK